jgi:hypothetical protein
MPLIPRVIERTARIVKTRKRIDEIYAHHTQSVEYGLIDRVIEHH